MGRRSREISVEMPRSVLTVRQNDVLPRLHFNRINRMFFGAVHDRSALTKMVPRSRAGAWLTALRCLPLSIAWATGSHQRPRDGGSRTSHRFAACEQSNSEQPLRTFQTSVDKYYQKHSELPLPKESHVVLPMFSNNKSRRRGVLVIGDVHGCFEELLELHEKAVMRNDGMPFQYVILVGDMVNKGPYSTRVVRHVRSLASEGWRSVRGNHDSGALLAAVGEASRRDQKKYQWIFDADEPLSDNDVEWMAELPYTIRIRGSLLEREDDIVVVHAGFVPGKEIESQLVSDMITIRNVKLERETLDKPIFYSRADKKSSDAHPWASVWRGEEFVIFGHDAARGLQEHEKALGLDTGACYGKLLTGIILPQEVLVHVHSSKVYCPINNNKTNE
ncbi:hypothetical protein MPSEU_000708300 [Mayamaea pseudoterrestris]|nr:hypothetical protein MPSEU_000708300 [Mayamaea pseudoterrestris]